MRYVWFACTLIALPFTFLFWVFGAVTYYIGRSICQLGLLSMRCETVILGFLLHVGPEPKPKTEIQ